MGSEGITSPSRRDGVTPLGDQLRAERERRGQVLRQVADATKIRTTYLEAIEAHDWKALPADVFTRGYVRSYAEYLGLDHEHLLKAYARERRIAGAGDVLDDDAKAILKRLARTHGVKTGGIGTRTKWIVLGLSGAGLAAVAVWAFLFPGATVQARNAPATVGAPKHAERIAVAAPAAPPPPKDVSDVATMAKPLPASPAEPIAVEAPKHAERNARVSDVASAAKRLPAPPVEAESSSSGPMKVEDSGVGTDVVAHHLVGRADRFREGTVVSFWTSVTGGRPGDKIRHVWLHGGRSVAVTELNVNGAHWRTQSRRPLPEGSTGDWTVEARDPEGHVIASAAFTCVAAD
ncbi:MAG TPA: DUF2914 domain-containing protein [Candidatus Polarisedimenticolaceae bacterium]|nr:DUF2914 domain-containing protein [Candidatus Polarisedimenticolaceae bacterium]